LTTIVDPIMRRFRAALDEAYGDRIARVVLVGSRARGDARSDFGLRRRGFLEELNSFWQEPGVIAAIESEILMDEGVVIKALPFAEGSYRERTGFMGEIRREGRDL
jgi:predicted nucleotidyltransferase